MCAIGLVYQTLDLVFHYWNQKIVVNIKYLDNAIDSIPGITICYDSGLSLEKIAERFAQYKKVYDQYLKLAPDLTLKGNFYNKMLSSIIYINLNKLN